MHLCLQELIKQCTPHQHILFYNNTLKKSTAFLSTKNNLSVNATEKKFTIKQVSRNNSKKWKEQNFNFYFLTEDINIFSTFQYFQLSRHYNVNDK